MPPGTCDMKLKFVYIVSDNPIKTKIREMCDGR
jgi:hypothetical protein